MEALPGVKKPSTKFRFGETSVSKVVRVWVFVMDSAASEHGFQKLRKTREMKILILRLVLREARGNGLGNRYEVMDDLGLVIFLSSVCRQV